MTKKLFVGNLSQNTSSKDLKSTFEKFGIVESAEVIKNKDTYKSKGFGFVEMQTEAQATEAINNLNNTEIDGKNISVTEARPLVPNDPKLK